MTNLTKNQQGIVIRQRVPLLVRLAMLPLLAAGVWMFYLFFVTVVHLMPGEPDSDFSAIQLLCLTGGLLLGLPGLIGFLVSKSVLIDQTEECVDEIQDFGLFRKTDRTGLADIEFVAVTWDQQRSDAAQGRRRMPNYYNVNLVRSRKRGAIDVAVLRTHAGALSLANELAEILKIPCKDLSYAQAEAM